MLVIDQEIHRCGDFGGRMWLCCDVGTVNICPDSNNSVKFKIFMVHDSPLGFDLLAGNEAIMALGGINIMPTGAVWLCSKETATCMAIHNDQTDFVVEFNHQQTIWSPT